MYSNFQVGHCKRAKKGRGNSCSHHCKMQQFVSTIYAFQDAEIKEDFTAQEIRRRWVAWFRDVWFGRSVGGEFSGSCRCARIGTLRPDDDNEVALVIAIRAVAATHVIRCKTVGVHRTQLGIHTASGSAHRRRLLLLTRINFVRTCRAFLATVVVGVVVLVVTMLVIRRESVQFYNVLTNK